MSQKKKARTPPLALHEVIQRTDAGLKEANALVADGYAGMGVARAIGSFEHFLKAAFLRPHLERCLGGPNSLTDEAVKRLFSGHRDEMKNLVRVACDIDMCSLNQQHWETYTRGLELRNEVLHSGATCSVDEARDVIRAVNGLLRSLLTARTTVVEPLSRIA